ncbi:MAG: hypothetical protein UW41_C0027G0012 [Candidatus Collierbacteria bacterium GW2011_GWC2_44_18]|uniref:Uncharacterized protein n=2 Tax=Microgenomates group TaxID=1794810 RepID=A0A0G1J4V3_9BACT|nr:MAG: hypothetical protein UW16_C0025G0019 [Microgenomates group bacterium GW2011_GWC1_44_10]KKT48499.1 MAG: hypothetical protein UW41_C0027G0012 [Candidatus Collierbacteria bacterium GW2011_GWC2_44_18]KKT66363.1 MAG: hypothetical protein UW60_C0025G0023 [Candidatus Woesebacteria bacterium GW2011_GWA2_44_33]
MPLKQDDFETYLVSEYFKHGSINKVFSAHHYNLPISFAGFTRVLTKYHVVKSAGPNSNLSESLHILSKIVDYKIPLERIYHQFAPKTIQVSTNTLHRILHYTRLGLTRRQGAALVINPKESVERYLLGNDLSLSNPSLGRKGDLSLPMGHSKIGENPRESILRVLQQEVFTNLVLEDRFPFHLIPVHPKPLMYINIADIRVSVYHIELDKELNFSSFKLSNLRFKKLNDISALKTRPGILEIIQNYEKLSLQPEPSTTPEFNSNLNSNIFALAEIHSSG